MRWFILRIPGAASVPGEQRLTMVLRWTVAGLLLLAAVGKIADYGSLLEAVARLNWLPDSFVVPAAMLLVVFELAVGALLASGQALPLAAAVGAAMFGGFTITTAVLIAQKGWASHCPCFGLLVQLPPALILGLDLCLFAACCALLLSNPLRGVAPAAAWGDVALRRRFHLAVYGLAVYTLAMTFAMQTGFAKERQRARMIEKRVIVLRYGDRAPDFTLVSSDGRQVTAAMLRGKWTLITFVSNLCRPCEDQLREIAGRYRAWKSRINVVVVVVGKPLFGSPARAAMRFARRLGLPMTIASDPDGSVRARYCDRPYRTPFSVLLDPDGIVRHIEEGRDSDEFGLVADIDHLLAGDEVYGSGVLRRNGVIFGTRAPDGELVSPESGTVKLSRLWARGPLVLSFLRENCAPCDRHVGLLERALGEAPSATVVYVYPSHRQAGMAARRLTPRGIVAVDTTRKVAMAYHAWNAPKTFLIAHGRLQFASGERSSELGLVRLLRLGDRASLSTGPTVGKDVPRKEVIRGSLNSGCVHGRGLDISCLPGPGRPGTAGLGGRVLLPG